MKAFFSNILNTNYGILYITLISSVLTFITDRNSHYIFQPDKYEYHLNNGSEFLIQIKNKIEKPFEHQEHSPSSNLSKREFRFLVPLVGNFLGLNYYTIFILSFLMNVILIFCVSLIFEQNFINRRSNLWLTLGFSFTFLGKCGFSDPMTGHFDVFAHVLVLLAFHSRLYLKLGLYFLAFWVDERVFISFILQYLIDSKTSKHLLKLTLSYGTVAVFVVSARIILSNLFGLFTPIGGNASVGLEVLPVNFSNLFLLGIFSSFEFGWLFILYFFLYHYEGNKFIEHIFLVSFTILSIVLSCMVGDISRSISYLLPVYIYSILQLANQIDRKTLEKFGYMICLSNFLIGSYYYVFGSGLHSLVPTFYFAKQLIVKTIQLIQL